MARDGVMWLCRRLEGGTVRFGSAQGGAWLFSETEGMSEARLGWA